MKFNWSKICGFALLVSIFSYLVLQQLPTYRFPLPGLIMDRIWKIVSIGLVVLFVGGLIFRAVKRQVDPKYWLRWQIMVSGFVGILLFQGLLYFSFPLYYQLAEEAKLSKTLSDIPTAQTGLLPEKISPKDIDQRCTFSDGYGVIYYQGGYRLTNADNVVSLQNYVQYDNEVKYFPTRDKALAYGNDAQMLLLDFDACQISQFPVGFRFNTSHFLQFLRSISPEGKFVIYEIYHGYRVPPFPGSEKDFSDADALKNGFWLYNMETDRNYQILSLPVDIETEDLKITWSSNRLMLAGINCPPAGCQFDLNDY